LSFVMLLLQAIIVTCSLSAVHVTQKMKNSLARLQASLTISNHAPLSDYKRLRFSSFSLFLILVCNLNLQPENAPQSQYHQKMLRAFAAI
jgi:hypothetical protein